MTEIPNFAPGCFGSALAFKSEDVVCSNCPFAAACEPAHLEARRLLRERYGLQTTQEVVRAEISARKAEKEERSRALDPSALTLPKKTQELIQRLDRGQYDVVGKLQRGENPFGSAIPFMRVLCHLLLKGFQLRQDTLTTAFAKQFNWQSGTAAAHARMAIQALEHVGAVENRDGIISIRRA